MSATDISRKHETRSALTALRPRRQEGTLRVLPDPSPGSASQAEGVTGRELRAAIGSFATGVTVVTSTSPAGMPLGSTANAVSSVSLDPPLVLVCLRNESETLAALLGHGHFAVNVLHQDQIEHAQTFAKPTTGEIWDGVGHRVSAHQLPLLEGSLATLQCKLHDVADGGDHKIVIGRVLEVEHPEAHQDPLLFYRGAFAQLDQPEEDQATAVGATAEDVFLPTADGDLRLVPVEHGEGSPLTSVIALVGQPQDSTGALVYLHAACIFGDALGHLHCRRRASLQAAMRRIRAARSGVLVYHRDDSSPFAGCCAGTPEVQAPEVPDAAKPLGALRDALDRLRLSGVLLLRPEHAEGGLNPLALGLDVAAVEPIVHLHEQAGG
ncbi:MAG: flavin reductase [Solirubrobacteraceae bacterium]